MKKDIHPKWHEEARVSCACGHSFTVGSSKPELRVDICSKCHPFFTGKMKFVDTMGRVEKFQKAQKEATKHKAALDAKKQKKQDQDTRSRNQKSLKDMLMEMH